MQFQWYPGHMTKAKRQMQEDIKLIDLVIELVDARIPLSSRNPDIDELGKNKARLILMNKSDLADEEAGKLWSAYFQKKGYYVVSLDSRNRNGMKQVTAVVMEACKEKIERDRKRGIMNRPVRAMVVGIPNVGKSTFINSYAGKACAKTGNKPGVTKGKQWIRLNKNVELLDTPGILWPKFEDQTVGLKLALIGAIKDEIFNIDELSLELIKVLTAYYPGALQARYGTEEQAIDETAAPAEILRGIAENRRCVAKGGEIDYSKAAAASLAGSHWSGPTSTGSGNIRRERKQMETKKIGEIREEFKAAEETMLPSFIEKYRSDERAGVQKLIEQANGRLAKLEAERARIDRLWKYEREYGMYTRICGIDEVGRGPLAGPVVAGAVILPKDCDILYINDSKKLSAAKREELYDVIMEKAVAVGIGMVGPERIDEINILQATYEAMREAISKLGDAPDILLNDAVTIPGVAIRQVPIIKGDAKSISIGAASIVAKVTRDRLMVEYDKIMPGYGFAANKGYGSAEHIAALKKYGPTPIHRRSFIGNFVEV